MKTLIRTILILCLLNIYACQPNEKAHSLETSSKMEAYLHLTAEERLSPLHATESFQVAEGLEASLFASEPMVINPTNIDVDARGRVWVCESYNYSLPEDKRIEEGGRITILEDTDQDGKADKRTVFYQGEDVNIALGICVLGSKVYVTRSPNMLVFTDEDQDDKPDKKEVLFTGMGGPGDHSAHALVFGPDGKYYFNIGNAGGAIEKTEGNPIVDIAGKKVVAYGEDYIGGMIFRTNSDGSEFEVLGHNFRNNYEVAVDSYGNLWQSDNDDDGNRSVRINYILEFGNYGYRDEFTYESWQSPRTNMASEIPQRHWHQNDPGVVPNVLITGAGSPAGITIYEGDLLPSIFRGQVIHTDAGPNVVRAYPASKKGAGYTASIANMVKSVHDQWFRPIDVATAPDGSLMVGDWYDPGVGGGVAADFQKGRIFRIAPNTEKYSFSALDTSSLSKAIEGLKSPNMARRYIAWNYLHGKGEEAEEELLALFQGENDIYKARSLWLLGKIPTKGKQYVELALKDEDPNIRLVGIRLARQLDQDFISLVESAIHDPAPEVRRDIAIGLHLLSSEAAANTWAELAIQYDGEDRWYLEALGIGADHMWDQCLEKWREKMGDKWANQVGRNMVWRSRAALTPGLLAQIIKHPEVTRSELSRYFRAFDFQLAADKEEALVSLLATEPEHPHKAHVQSLVLQHITPEKHKMTASLREAIEETLKREEGTLEYVNIVKRFRLTDKKEALIQLAIDQSDNEVGREAIRVLIEPEDFRGDERVLRQMKEDHKHGISLVESMQTIGNKEALDILSEVVMNETYAMEVRKAAVRGLGKSWWGEDYLMECVEQPEFAEALKPVAGSVLFNVYRVTLQERAAEYLEKPTVATGEPLPPIRDLVASAGNGIEGVAIFDAQCKACHVVQGEGIAFGPELSEIGSKLSEEGLYRAVMFPNEGISHGYHGEMFHLKDESQMLGIVLSENEEFVRLRMMGGVDHQLAVSDIADREPYGQSLMPNLAVGMTQEELTDLVAYLMSLKKVEI